MSHSEPSSGSASETSVAVAKTSKPVGKERLLVRGVIGVLVLLLAIEGVAYGRMMITHWRLTSEIRKAERENHLIYRDRIEQIIGRLPDEKHMVKAPVGEEQYDVYYFWGLLQQRELCVHYGVPGMKGQAEAMEVTTIIPDEVLAK